jgi:hypothetical protein
MLEERTDQYPEGCPVTVYYNPQNPREAYLDLDHEDSPSVGLVGAASVIIGLAFAFGIWPPA